MYVGILQFQIEVDAPATDGWNKEARSLCEKLRARFKVVARVCESLGDNYCLAVVTLGERAAQVEQLFDKILAFSEASGIGRATLDLVFIEPLASFGEFEDAADSD